MIYHHHYNKNMNRPFITLLLLLPVVCQVTATRPGSEGPAGRLFPREDETWLGCSSNGGQPAQPWVPVKLVYLFLLPMTLLHLPLSPPPWIKQYNSPYQCRATLAGLFPIQPPYFKDNDVCTILNTTLIIRNIKHCVTSPISFRLFHLY